MFEYLWWLLPAFLKKSTTKGSSMQGLIEVISDELWEIKQSILKSRLSKFVSHHSTTTDYYQSEHAENLSLHASDRGLPGVPAESLIIDAVKRESLGSKVGMKYYLELMNPGVRLDFLYEIGADLKKWLIFNPTDLASEAAVNRSVLLNASDLALHSNAQNRSTRIYSKAEASTPEYLFWAKVYNPIGESGEFTVYPEKILNSLDRLKPAHTMGFLVFNFLDPEVLSPWDGQVFIGTSIDISGTIRTISTPANA
ncbi:MAG: hypothetical protein H8E18_16420 [FCB group bacterium]|nr:hypothetical protein [FCB group bacterium]